MLHEDLEMTLDRALVILADVHTRDDDLAGFLVEVGPTFMLRYGQDEYIEAWRIVREHIRRVEELSAAE